MANDQPQEVRVQAPNGDRVAVQIGSKGFALTTKDLVTVLLIVGMGVGFYLAVLALNTGQARGFAGLERILDHMATNQTAFVDKLTTTQTLVLERLAADRAHTDEILVRQNQQVNDQTTALQRLVDDQTGALRKMLIIVNWNLGHDPAEHLPIEWDPAQLPPPERGR
jgi:hypothetical protein